MGGVDDEPKWLTTLYWAGWAILWFFAALITLGCVFGFVFYHS